MSSGLYRAVCYRCSYEGVGGAARCPVCSFPVILEAEGTPPEGRKVVDILARASVREGGPPLPGVDAGKRKAQLMAEARRERAEQERARTAAVQGRVLPLRAPAVDARDRAGATGAEDFADMIPVRRGMTALKYALLGASALAAGVLAAALQG